MLCRKECVDLQVNVLYCGVCDNSCDNNTQVTTGGCPAIIACRSLIPASYRVNRELSKSRNPLPAKQGHVCAMQSLHRVYKGASWHSPNL